MIDGSWKPDITAKKNGPEDNLASKSKNSIPEETLGDEKKLKKAVKRKAKLVEEDGADSGRKQTRSPEQESERSDQNPQPTIYESDEYSDVIDIVPTKRKKPAKKDPSSPKKSTSTSTAGSKKKVPEPDDPQEAEVKRLQSQLTKCGVRKLWHNELKQYGDDMKGKIRHLKKMLADVGMDGRFSEAKAREIKETRELLAEAEAAQEMNRLWGMEEGGRRSRGKSRGKTIIESGSDDEDGDKSTGGSDGEDEEVVFAARRKRAAADLAFLGDDSDSE